MSVSVSVSSKISLKSAAIVYTLTALIVFSLIVLLNFWIHEAENRSDLGFREAAKVESLSKDILQTLTDAETGQRGYLLTLDPIFLEPYHEAGERLAGLMEELRSYIPKENWVSMQQDVLNRQSYFYQTFSAIERVATDKRAQQLEVIEMVRSGIGKAYMDSFRERLGDIITSYNEQAEMNKAELNRLAQIGLTLEILSAILLIIMLFLPVFVAVRKVLRPLDQLKHSLTKVVKTREFDFPESTNEFSEIHSILRNTRTAAEELLQYSALKEAQRKRNQLFGMVAHELRTPVSALSMMADEHSDDEWLKDRKSVKRTIADLLNTIDDMRLLINPELVRPVRTEAFLIEELNATIAASVASIVSATGVQYQQANLLPQNLLKQELMTDVYRVRVAITNLIKNACLHSMGTQVNMSIRFYTNRKGEEFLEWLVSDNGTGIAESDLDRLFQPGERGDSDAEGSGLGLHIAKSWIEEIGGNLAYRPRIKGGSEFFLRVPLRFERHNKSVQFGQIKDYESTERLLPQLNILMAEDEMMLRMLGEKILSRLVNSIDLAEDGRQGLERFDATKHNLILTDYFMPHMSGVEMIEKIRESGYQGVIVGVTAATIGEQKQEMLSAGADLVLPKPLKADNFKDAIAQLIAEGRFESLLTDTNTPL